MELDHDVNSLKKKILQDGDEKALNVILDSLSEQRKKVNEGELQLNKLQLQLDAERVGYCKKIDELECKNIELLQKLNSIKRGDNIGKTMSQMSKLSLLVDVVDCEKGEGPSNTQFHLHCLLPTDPTLLTEEEKNYLVEIFMFFHPYLMSDIDDEEVPCLTTKEFKVYALEDCRILTRCLYALSNGKPFCIEKAKSNRFWESLKYSSVIASDILAQSCRKKPCYFQRFFTGQMSINLVTKSFKRLCSLFRLSDSHEKLRQSGVKDLITSILHGVQYPQRGLVIFAIDNFGFKEKASYDQWTIMQLIQLTEEDLKQVGFYSNDPKKRISREHRSIASLVQENEFAGLDTAEYVAGIHAQDYCTLSNYVLTHINTALELPLPGKIECENMAKTGNYIWNHCEIPKSLGIKLLENRKKQVKSTEAFYPLPRIIVPFDASAADDNSSSSSDREVSYMEDSDESITDDEFDSNELQNARHFSDSREYKTLYERNQMCCDLAFHGDLAKQEVVRSFMDYALRATEVEQIGLEIKHDILNEPPVSEILVPMTGDGSPVEASHRIKDADRASGENKYDKIRFFPGGFHFALEQHRMRGRFFCDIFGWFVSKWRPTAGKQKWILEPSNPNDLNEELYEYILAMYRCAADCLVELKDCDEVSPAEVNEHMLHRASKYPFAMAVLMELRFAEVSLIIRDSEKSGPRGSVDLFITGMRFSLVLFSLTHAVKYVRICSEFLHWWASASDAEKVIFRNFIFTKISPHGHPIWADRCVESTMRHLRIFLGKHRQQGQDLKVLKVVNSIPNLIQARRGAIDMLDDTGNIDGDAWNDRSRPLSIVYVQTYNHCKKINLWGEGPIIMPCAINESVNDGSRQVLKTPNGAELNASMLQGFSIGKERVKSYYKRFYIETQNHVVRTEHDMGLACIQTSAHKIKAEVEKKVLQATSTSTDELNAACTIKILVEEIKSLQSLMPLSPPSRFNLLTAKKKDLITELVNMRRRYFRDNPEVKQQITDRIVRQDKDSLSNEEERKVELLDKFYSLDHTALTTAAVKVPIRTAITF